jgi:spoIIIJ-associated protein
MTEERMRRFFSGRSLAQAVASAAQYFGVDPETLAYQVRDKRHGFIKVRRAVVIEVDPAAPRRAPGEAAPVAAVAPAPPTASSSRTPSASRSSGRDPRPRETAGTRERSTSRRPRRDDGEGAAGSARRAGTRERVARKPEAWHEPDEEAVLAATEGAARLLRLAGLDLAARVRPGEERLEVELEGDDLPRLRELGARLLDDVEHLLPRAGYGLSGRLVRARVEGAGLRARREEVLRARAREAAEQVLASGEEVLIEPLDPGERRIVHLELAGRSDVATESVGSGAQRQIRVYATSGPGAGEAGEGAERPAR